MKALVLVRLEVVGAQGSRDQTVNHILRAFKPQGASDDQGTFMVTAATCKVEPEDGWARLVRVGGGAVVRTVRARSDGPAPA